MTGLEISTDLQLPLEAVTETFAILAKRGKGKTNTAVVMAEEMIAHQLPVVIVDPVGVWWGIRAAANGKDDGLPVVIFGGDHADVPLEATAGELIADVLVERRTPAVIDLSGFSKAASKRFMGPFLERLYHRNREALHVIIDEADEFAPQRPRPEGARVLGAMEDLVRRGRGRGIGVTLITQRPAVIHKDVLSQAEVLIALGMTGTHDVAAIDDWIKLHDVEDQAKEVKKSLPSLPVGTAWIWSPGWLDVLQRVQIRARHTFDSSATPKPGEKRRTPKAMTPVDLEQLGEQIAATVERAKADDPAALRRRIVQLERELAAARDIEPPKAELVHIQVPVVDEPTLEKYSELAGALMDVLATIEGELTKVANHEPPTPGNQGKPTTRSSAPRANSSDGTSRRARDVGTGTQGKRNPSSAREMRPVAGEGPPDGVQLKAGARRILETLGRHHPVRLTKSQIGALAKFKITGGTFQTYWSAIRRAGLIDDNGVDVGLTEAGCEYVGVDDLVPLSTDELLEQWRSALKAGARQMLDALVDVYPNGYDRAVLADQVAMTASGGTFQTYLSTLRRNGLVEIDAGGLITAASSLFLGDSR